MKVLFAAGETRWETWRGPLHDAVAEAGLDVDLALDHPAEEVEAIVYAPASPLQDFTPFTACRAVLSIWAGVEGIVGNATLTQPLARMVDPGLTEGMVEYVAGHVLRHHLNLDAHIGRTAGWHPEAPPLARDRRVTVLGLGALGRAVAEALAGLGFRVTGWSRGPHEVAGVTCLSGPEGLDAALAEAEILVLLLPLTDATRDLIDADRLAQLPPRAVLINPGRGALVVEDDLIDALDRGTLAHATLDTFRTEPLPEDHPFWALPRVTVTPHIASETRPATAARVIAENLRRLRDGAPLLHLVDRDLGY